MIEKIILDALERATEIKGCMEIPMDPPPYFFLIEKTGGGARNSQQRTATVAVQSYAPTLLEAAQLNDEIVGVMRELQFTEDSIITCELNSDYNFTDQNTKRYRYQAVFNLVYFD